MDAAKYPPGYASYFMPNPTLFGYATTYYLPAAALTLGFVQGCFQNGICTEDAGHTDDWAISKYSACMCSGHEGKCCEEPTLGCLMWCCCANPCISLRNAERQKLELIDGKQQYPVDKATGAGTDHCEGICLAACCGGACLGNCVTPCYMNLYNGARRKQLRNRYKIKGSAWDDFCDSGSLTATWQEAFELGKRQGYEIPGTNTANNKKTAAPAAADK